MDEIQVLLTVGAAAATGVAGWLIGRKPRVEQGLPVAEPEAPTPLRMEQHPGTPYEVDGRKFAPQRNHKHEYTVMVGDGWGWRCGVVTDGIECGRPKEARRGI